MAAPNTSRSSYRSLRQKISGPTFRVGMGKIYRDLEREGKIPAEGIEKKAAYEANKKAREEALAKKKSLGQRLKSMGKWFSELFD